MFYIQGINPVIDQSDEFSKIKPTFPGAIFTRADESSFWHVQRLFTCRGKTYEFEVASVNSWLLLENDLLCYPQKEQVMGYIILVKVYFWFNKLISNYFFFLQWIWLPVWDLNLYTLKLSLIVENIKYS